MKNRNSAFAFVSIGLSIVLGLAISVYLARGLNVATAVFFGFAVATYVFLIHAFIGTVRLNRFEERRFRSLVEATTAIVWNTPASGEFEEPQPSWTAFTGQSFAELRGWGWLNAVHPDDRAVTARIWSAAVANPRMCEVEHRLRAHDQSFRNMLVRAVPIIEHGRVVQWIGVHTDITESKRAEQELLWKTALMEAQLNASVDAIFVIDKNGRRISQNQRVAELLRLPDHVASAFEGEAHLRWVTDLTKNPAEFLAKARHLIAHPDEVCRDEIEFKDGTVLDRYSGPVIGKGGEYYGRLVTLRDITERKRSEAAINQRDTESKKSEESLRLLGSAVKQSRESIIITDAELDLPGPRIVFVNPAFTAMTGYTAEEALGATPRFLQGPRTDPAVLRRMRGNLAQGENFTGETINYRKDGSEFTIEWQIAPIRDGTGTLTHFVAIQRDISERKRLEVQALESQKMETVGKLAGGIAHEFNSILTAIIGQSELLQGDLPVGSPLAERATEINKAAGRAASLTRQLLAYGRQQSLQSELLDLNKVLARMEGMLHHLLGDGVDIRIAPAPELHAVKVDLAQIEQVIVNMAMNAGEAMPRGGRLTFETANVSIDQDSIGRDPQSKPGQYVMLAVTDTGTGMSIAVKERVFEPFFSTKGVGEGTGLGLSTCYGIIKQSGGYITVYSEPAQGAIFKIYLPYGEHRVPTPVPILDSPDLPGGSETILLVEDEPALRDMATELLRRLGYQVLAAADGVEALSLSQQDGVAPIDLVFTDLIMPQISGEELSARMQALYPNIRILFTSAYTRNVIIHQGLLNGDVALLPKPFTPSALAHKLRAMLDRPTLTAATNGKDKESPPGDEFSL